MLKLTHSLLNHILAHARKQAPQECCGLIGGDAEGKATNVYRMRNVAATPLVTYEAAPEDLFAAQRAMRARGEELIVIYHSHPRSKDPQPSETDVRLAYYPSAGFLLVWGGGEEHCRRGVCLSGRAG